MILAFDKEITNKFSILYNLSNLHIFTRNIRRQCAISEADQPTEHVDYRKNLDSKVCDLLNCGLRRAMRTFDISVP